MYIYVHTHIYQANFENCVLDLGEGFRGLLNRRTNEGPNFGVNNS